MKNETECLLVKQRAHHRERTKVKLTSERAGGVIYTQSSEHRLESAPSAVSGTDSINEPVGGAYLCSISIHIHIKGPPDTTASTLRTKKASYTVEAKQASQLKQRPTKRRRQTCSPLQYFAALHCTVRTSTPTDPPVSRYVGAVRHTHRQTEIGRKVLREEVTRTETKPRLARRQFVVPVIDCILQSRLIDSCTQRGQHARTHHKRSCPESSLLCAPPDSDSRALRAFFPSPQQQSLRIDLSCSLCVCRCAYVCFVAAEPRPAGGPPSGALVSGREAALSIAPTHGRASNFLFLFPSSMPYLYVCLYGLA